MRIHYNAAAMTAVRNLGILNGKQASLSEKLSSGYRINRAADDAAGLKISEKMRAQIRGLKQASNNAQDGISLLQTADGALNEVHSMLQRVRELSVQAANDTNVTADRQSIQDEIDQLLQEIDRISGQTEFNTRKIFDGSLASGTTTTSNRIFENEVFEQYGIEDKFNATQTTAGSSSVGTYTALADLLDKEIVPQAVNGVMDMYSGAFGYLKDSSTGIGLVIENKPTSQVLASVGMEATNGRYKADGSITYDLGFILTVNAGRLDFNSDGSLTDDSRRDLETTIVHEMVHGFMDEVMTAGMTGYTAGKFTDSKSYPKWFKEGMAQTAAGGYSNGNDWVNGGLGITTSSSVSIISSIVKASANKLTNTTNGQGSYGTGYLACMYLGQLASGKGTSAANISAENIRSGLDNILKKLGEGNSLSTVIKDVSGGMYTSISDFEKKFGDTQSATFIYDLTHIVGEGNGSLIGGDLTATDLLPNSEASSTVFDLNPSTKEVLNKYPDDINVMSGGTGETNGTAPVTNYGTGGTTPPTSGGSNINVSTIKTGNGAGYTFDGTTLTITGDGDYTLTGTRSGISIVIADGVKTNIGMKNLNLTSTLSSGITVGKGSNVTLDVSGTNTVTSKTGAAINVVPTGTLNITGDGKLTANAGSGSGAAAIGGNSGKDTGTININGTSGKELVIDANGDDVTFGIGAGKNATGGSVMKTCGIILDGSDNSGIVYGNVRVTDKIDMKGGTLSVGVRATLTVSSTGSIVSGSGDATIYNNGDIKNYGNLGSKIIKNGGSQTIHYVSLINNKKPSDVTAGNKLLTSKDSTATITFNGKQTTTLTGTWSVTDSSGSTISDPLAIDAEEGQNYKYSVTYRLSDAQIADGLTFASSSSFTSSIIENDTLALFSQDITQADSDILNSISIDSQGAAPDGHSYTVTYKMTPRKAPAVGGSAVSADGFMLQVGANAGQGVSINIDKLNTDELGIKDLSVLTHDDASDAIDLVDKAINKVSTVRSKIGAYQNRLEYTIDNLENTAENLQTAESRIRDLDIASAMVEYAKNQILIQAAQAMIVQANQTPNGILQLLH